MAGSKKGERRGNARKRPGRPPGSRSAKPNGTPEKNRTHETPGEIMNEAVRKHHGRSRLETPSVERRIQVSRIILGYSGAVEDITPKEAMLMGMRHGLQAIRDLTDMLEQLAQLPATAEVTAQINELEREIERQHAVAGEFAFKVAGFIHPKLVATHSTIETGANQASVVQELLDEINELERNKPIPIEHKPQRTG